MQIKLDPERQDEYPANDVAICTKTDFIKGRCRGINLRRQPVRDR